MQTLILGASVTPTPPFKPQNDSHPLKLSPARAGEHLRTCRKLRRNFHFSFSRTGGLHLPPDIPGAEMLRAQLPPRWQQDPGPHTPGWLCGRKR